MCMSVCLWSQLIVAVSSGFAVICSHMVSLFILSSLKVFRTVMPMLLSCRSVSLPSVVFVNNSEKHYQPHWLEWRAVRILEDQPSINVFISRYTDGSDRSGAFRLLALLSVNVNVIVFSLASSRAVPLRCSHLQQDAYSLKHECLQHLFETVGRFFTGGSCSNWQLVPKLRAGHSECLLATCVCCNAWNTEVTKSRWMLIQINFLSTG